MSGDVQHPSESVFTLGRNGRLRWSGIRIYQPLMLKTMLERGGSASIRQIATAFLNEDESQIEYYEQIVNNMPGRVLAKHAIVERNGDLFRLDASVATLTKPERAKLATLCQEAIVKFKAARGAAIWEHRRPGLGIIPGKQRYQTLKAAGFRCELCGVSADERSRATRTGQWPDSTWGSMTANPPAKRWSTATCISFLGVQPTCPIRAAVSEM